MSDCDSPYDLAAIAARSQESTDTKLERIAAGIILLKHEMDARRRLEAKVANLQDDVDYLFGVVAQAKEDI